MSGRENWGRWGADDEAGTLNLIGPDQVRRGISLIREGLVVSLAMTLGPKTPGSPHRKPVERYMMRDGGDYAAGARRPGGFQFAEEVVSFAAHSGTHIDALAHVWCDDQLYNGHSAHHVRSTTGAVRCGADKLKPICTRGLLLDVAAVRGRPLAAGEEVSVDDLKAACELAGGHPEPGDAILVRTGWIATAFSDPAAYFAEEPGLGPGAAEWLARADVAVIGSDNCAIEVMPFKDGAVFPVHQLLIRSFGMPLIENMMLDALAETGRRRFLFVAAPIPLENGTAGPVCPVAIV